MRIIICALCCCWFTSAVALAQIGPPQPRAEPLNFSLGVGVHNVNSTWTPYDYEISRNRIYFEGSFAFTDSIEAFGRVGGSDFVINDIETYELGKTRDVSADGYPAFFSGGVRGMLWESDGWSIGASLEVAIYSSLADNIRWTHNVYQELTFDAPLEVNIGIPVAYRWEAGVIYCGPLLHFGYTRGDVRTHEFGPGWEIEDEVNALTVRDKAGWGAFAGWQMPLGDAGWHLQIEGAALNGGFGGAVAFFKAL